MMNTLALLCVYAQECLLGERAHLTLLMDDDASSFTCEEPDVEVRNSEPRLCLRVNLSAEKGH